MQTEHSELAVIFCMKVSGFLGAAVVVGVEVVVFVVDVGVVVVQPRPLVSQQ